MSTHNRKSLLWWLTGRYFSPNFEWRTVSTNSFTSLYKYRLQPSQCKIIFVSTVLWKKQQQKGKCSSQEILTVTWKLCPTHFPYRVQPVLPVALNLGTDLRWILMYALANSKWAWTGDERKGIQNSIFLVRIRQLPAGPQRATWPTEVQITN